MVHNSKCKTTHNQTTKHPGQEQQEELGREAIAADLEHTDDHEEATEEHPGAGELDRIFGGDAPFPEMAATSCGMPVDF